MLALERRNLILEKLQEDKRVVVSELSQIFKVSEETIRRDLERFEKEGLVTKSYGGAVLNESTGVDMPFNVRKKTNVKGKQIIAGEIAERIHDGEYIVLDASSTAVFVAKAIKEKSNVTVITNSIEIVIELSDLPNLNVICTGGQLQKGYLALVGPRTMESIRCFNVDKAIISCKGIEMEKGITDGNELFSQAKQVMMDCARETILAVDSTKFDKIAFSKLCDAGTVRTIVTDAAPSEKWLAFFKENQIECIYPGHE